MKLKRILLSLILFFLAFSIATPLLAKSDDDKLRELNEKIEKYTKKIGELQGKQKTLSSAINYLDSKVKLTSTQIAKTEQELKILAEDISKLSVKIDVLNKSLIEVSTFFNSRIKEAYKRSLVNPFYFLFSSQGFSDLFSRLKYLQIVQMHDRDLLFRMQKSKMNYDNQKIQKKEKKEEEEALKEQLEKQRAVLAQQKQQKQELLTITKNDEQKFQQLLAAARAEMEAIQSIMAGYGEETKIGDVNEGEKIASIISGSSACSTGTHLHFEIAVGGSNVNPASYLKSKSVDWDLCGWYGCDSEFAFSGSWNWPMNDRITITQGYGMTAYARSGAYGGNPHSGIDMVSDDLSVKAVKQGTLYRGSIACGGGTLRYVKVDHKDSDIDTYYLHVNYY